MHSATRTLLAVSALAWAFGCDETTYVIDPFPVSVDFTTNGVPTLRGCVTGVAPCGDGETRLTVIDTGTAVTMVAAAQAGPATRRSTTLELRDFLSLAPRARFTSFPALVMPLGGIGIEGGDAFVDGDGLIIVGGDVLSRVAVRLDPSAGSIFFFPDIAGENDVLGRTCSAVIPAARAGGGSLELDGAEVDFAPTRLVVGACLNPDEPGPRAMPRRPSGGGADALLLVSTGLPVTVLSRSAYARATPDGPAFETLPTGVLQLPGGAPGGGVEVRLGSLSWLGLTADEHVGEGPCDELLASRMMDLGGCKGLEKCLCQTGISDTKRTRSCEAAGSVEMAGPITVAVVDDASPVLTALRIELAPSLADIDGFLGMNALGVLVTDVDYPNGRLVLRCVSEREADGTCAARPGIASLEVRADLFARGCLLKQSWIVTPPDGTALP